MAKGMPSRTELEKAMIVNTFTTILGVVLGIMITQAWKNHKTKQNQLLTPNSPMFGGID